MVDILLINPPLVDYDKKNKPKFFVNTSFFPPINLAYLSSYLEKFGFTTIIIDMDAEKFGVNSISKMINILKPKVIGVGITSDVIYPISTEIFKKIKEVKDLPIIVGGVFATNNPDLLAKRKNIDFLIRGEGEQTLLELMNYILKNEGELKQIKGLSFKSNTNFGTTST